MQVRSLSVVTDLEAINVVLKKKNIIYIYVYIYICMYQAAIWYLKGECLSIWLSSFTIPWSVNGLRSRTRFEKHAYSNMLKISPSKTESFSDKNSDIFHISAQNKDCGYSLKPPRRVLLKCTHNLCFWAEIRKIVYTPVKPSFTI